MPEGDSFELSVRILEAEDAHRLISCIRRCYGDSYFDPRVYDEDALRRRLESGLQHSIAAVNEEGEVVGHMSIVLRRHGDNTGDAGMTLVDPRYRGRKIALRVAVGLAERAAELGLVGMHDYPVTVHSATQRIGAEGAVYVGIMIDMTPADMDFREMSNDRVSGRSSTLVRYFPGGGAPRREVFVPPVYAQHAESIFREARLDRAIAPGREPGDSSGALDLAVDERRSVVRISAGSVGADFASTLDDRLREAAGGDVVLILLDLPLADRGTPGACDVARARGFFFSGILPEYRDGDVLRLQRLARPESANREVVLEAEGAKAMAEVVWSDFEVVRASGA